MKQTILYTDIQSISTNTDTNASISAPYILSTATGQQGLLGRLNFALQTLYFVLCMLTCQRRGEYKWLGGAVWHCFVSCNLFPSHVAKSKTRLQQREKTRSSTTGTTITDNVQEDHMTVTCISQCSQHWH